MTHASRTLLAATLGLITIALTVLALTGSPFAAAPPTAAHTTTPTTAPHAGGTAVSSTLDSTSSADAAFLADLFDGATTDLTAQQAADLTATAHRICDLGQPRADWLAALTAPGPHALTAGEAGKLLDTAEAAYCPQALTGYSG